MTSPLIPTPLNLWIPQNLNTYELWYFLLKFWPESQSFLDGRRWHVLRSIAIFNTDCLIAVEYFGNFGDGFPDNSSNYPLRNDNIPEMEIEEETLLAKESLLEMSARIGYQLEDISRYLDGLREQRKASEDIIGHLKKERELISLQIDELRMKLNALDTRIGKEEEICSRLERTIAHANETYEKLVESSQSLVDYVKKEYEGARSSGSSLI
ncbi:unnamed protein product [Acanthocheilonema viteae]|uniref:Uncharacterized protein n=1 Tax=Acanthocheilonema viteae TaxID=6277 RepID=A0A498SC12_ACAVI|nr:unnamed protein product [Acanthocheilonema viteae]